MKLFSNGGKEAASYFEEHSDVVLETVKIARDAIEAYLKGDISKGDKLTSKVNDLETKADSKGSKFEKSLREGAFLPAFREDFSKLCEAVDDVADIADSALRTFSRRLDIIEELDEAEKFNMKGCKNNILQLFNQAVKTTEALNGAVNAIFENMDEAPKLTDEIHKRERKADFIEEDLLKDLYASGDTFSHIGFIQLKELIEKASGISDMAEDAGDVISSTYVGLKT